MKKRLVILGFVILALAYLQGYAENAPLAANLNPILRVRIIDDSPVVSLRLEKGYKVYSMESDNPLSEGEFLETKITPAPEGLMFGEKPVKSSGVRVKVDTDSTIYVEGRRFRGEVDIVKKDSGKLMVVNHIPIENYLYGVLHHEVSHRWPMDALKAQAIAARTFALYQARQNRSQPYDLTSDIYSQVYGGSASEKWTTTKAVNITAGKVLTYKGDIFPTYYHATCAGSTEDASNLWNINLPTLRSVNCNYCIHSPHYKWRKAIPLKALEDNLNKGGFKIGKISHVKVLTRNRSGRADKLEIKDAAGGSIFLSAKDFRQLVGPNEIRSTRFDLSMGRGELIVNGRGWGHGVGMCQWGIDGMARQGKKTSEILKYYYPGSEITSIDKVAAKL